MRAIIIGTLVAVLAGALLLDCGGSETDHAACQSSSDCKTGEMCHPLAKVCVQTCTQSADCPSSANSCAPLTLPDGSQTADQICQCATDAQCGGGQGSSAICGSEDKICETKCGSDADCNGRTCDTATGQCHTAAQQNTCDPNNLTLGSSGGPDTCAYGQYCASNSQCFDAQQGGCSEAGQAGAGSWDKSGQTAPVITSIVAQGLGSTNPSTECLDGGVGTLFTINYYAPGGLTTETQFQNWRTQFWVATNATTQFTNPAFGRKSPVTDGGVFDQVQVGICGEETGQAAWYLTNSSAQGGQAGNTECLSW